MTSAQKNDKNETLAPFACVLSKLSYALVAYNNNNKKKKNGNNKNYIISISYQCDTCDLCLYAMQWTVNGLRGVLVR